MAEIYLHIDGKQAGPYQPGQVRELLAGGKITGETSAWYQGLSQWSTVSNVLAAFPAEVAAVGSVPPPPQMPPVPMPPPATAAPVKKGMSGCVLAIIIVCVVGFVSIPFIACLAGIALGPITNGIKRAKQSVAMQHVRTIEIMMFAYANDHNGAYPDGKTSTEVFQKLIDGNYVTDPSIFYAAMPGKTKPTSNTLTADNVCYDVTSGVTLDASDDLPVVFSTGYTVTYSPGSSATRDPGAQTPFDGMAVANKNNSARFMPDKGGGELPHFIPVNFDSGGKTYEQLRP
jgi:hypothetical protein